MAAVSIALNRFGLGARPDEPAPADPRKWLSAQFDTYDARPAALAGTPTRAQVTTHVVAYQDGEVQYVREERERVAAAKSQQQSGAPGGDMASMSGAPGMSAAVKPATARGQSPINLAARALYLDYVASVGARTNIAVTTPAPFVERMVHFWSNHFTVSNSKLPVTGLAGPFEFEAIRPHVLGKFRDMLGAVESHPAMLIYLDQDRSIGPNSKVGKLFTYPDGRPQFGINENLAREILELHTLGAGSGYTQADVTEFARVMTGRNVNGGMSTRLPDRFGPPAQPGDYVFVDAMHEPGARTILGKSYAQPGEAQSQAVLDDLAASPATAAHISTKLARHFCGDVPPPALVDRLKTAWLKSDGDLPTLYHVLIDSQEAWAPAPLKFKTPWEWSLSVWRATGAREVRPDTIVGLLDQLGQPIWKAGQPNGYDDIASSWAAPDAVLRRIEAAQSFAEHAGPIDARALAPRLFPDALSPATAQSLARAESPTQAVALLLVAPEMMRR